MSTSPSATSPQNAILSYQVRRLGQLEVPRGTHETVADGCFSSPVFRSQHRAQRRSGVGRVVWDHRGCGRGCVSSHQSLHIKLPHATENLSLSLLAAFLLCSPTAAAGVLYGRHGIAVSFPFFNGWGNWTEADVEDAVNVAAEVLT